MPERRRRLGLAFRGFADRLPPVDGAHATTLHPQPAADAVDGPEVERVAAQEDDVAEALAHERNGDRLDVGGEDCGTDVDGPGPGAQLERVAVGDRRRDEAVGLLRDQQRDRIGDDEVGAQRAVPASLLDRGQGKQQRVALRQGPGELRAGHFRDPPRRDARGPWCRGSWRIGAHGLCSRTAAGTSSREAIATGLPLLADSVMAMADLHGSARVLDVGEDGRAGQERVREVVDLALERMVRHRSGIGRVAGDEREVLLSGEEVVGEQPVVADGAPRAQEVDVELIREAHSVQRRRKAARVCRPGT